MTRRLTIILISLLGIASGACLAARPPMPPQAYVMRITQVYESTPLPTKRGCQTVSGEWRSLSNAAKDGWAEVVSCVPVEAP